MGGGCEFRVEFICSTGRAPHLIHSDPGDTAFMEFMKQFIQLIEDREKERNNCRMEDYAVDFMVGCTEFGCLNKVNHSENDDTRVVLKTNDKYKHDYINASYVSNKCERYWPPKGVPLRIEKCGLTLTNICEEASNENLLKRNFRAVVTDDQNETVSDYVRDIRMPAWPVRVLQIIHHYQYTEWPDYGRPDKVEPLIELLEEVHSVHRPGAPIVVHCSDGVGRTGTICAIDIAAELLRTGRALSSKVSSESKAVTTGDSAQIYKNIQQTSGAQQSSSVRIGDVKASAANVQLGTMHIADPFDAPVFVAHDSAPGHDGCVDLDTRCSAWASQGECTHNTAWMVGLQYGSVIVLIHLFKMGNCRRSCKSCQGGDRAWQLRAKIAEGYDTPASPGTPGVKQKNYSTTNVTVKSAALDHLEVVGV
ncbi:unnamed protein product [Sphagnum balticum]